MKFPALLGLSIVTCISSNDFLIPTADSKEGTDETFLTPEDYQFWSRLLKDEFSIPTAPPVNESTTTPIKAPVTPPITPPIKPTVKAPQSPPVLPPITPPIKAPVTPPITPPVKTPTAPTVKAPQTLPVRPPLTPQAKSPMSLPKTPPITSPVKSPVTPSVKAPKNPPAASPLMCDVDVTIDCVTSEGLPCNALQPPSPVCSGSDVVAVTFGYSGNACNPTGNSQGAEAFCEDIGAIDKSVSVTILCRDANVITTGLVVEPPTIPLGGVFTISAPSGNLPEKVDCIILDSAETQLQQIVIDTSGDVSLNLRDEFGAFTLLACGDSGVGGVQSCLETLSYTIDINNVGTVGMEVSIAEFIFDGVTTSFVSDIDTNISPGKSSTVETRQTIDLCVVAEYCAEIKVVANPPNGNECQDTDQYCFQVSQLPPAPIVAPAVVPPASVPSAPVPTPRNLPVPVPEPVPVIQIPAKTPVAPAPAPVPASAPIPQPNPPVKPPAPASCVLEVSTTCVIAGSSSSAGKSCDTPSLGIEPCLERPLQITMLYNGGDCSQSDNDQLLKFTCADSNGGPPTAEGATSYIIVTDIRGMGITYFQGTVPIGSQYILGDGVNRVEADMLINIFSTDRTTLLQSVQYHSSCSSTLELKNRFGASQIVQYYNTLQGNVSCFADFSFSADIEVPISAGAGNVTLTSLVANTNFAAQIDLTGQVAGVVVSPGDTVQVNLQGTIDASIRRMYVIMFEILGVKSSGTVCTGSDTLSFEAGNIPGAPSPASLPTAPLPTTPTSKTKKGPTSPGVIVPSSSGYMSSGSMSSGSKSTGSKSSGSESKG
jgi:hypothetical protein